MRRSDPAEPGFGRRRCGRGFRYLGTGGEPITDRAVIERIKALVIPPAWAEVWICPDAGGHIQAVGTDDAGRRQYLYHPEWRAERDREKHDHVLDLGAVLPEVRERLAADLAGRGYTRERVLAAAVRLIDLGFFRIGGERYESENGTYGLATVLREHVTCARGEITFRYPAKHAKELHRSVAEEAVCKVITGLKRRAGDGPELLAHRAGDGGWHDVTTTDINTYIQEVTGGDFTAKDFRTWHATVLAAVGLAVSTGAPDSESARRKAVARVVQEVAGYLGNTPAVARASYIDPRVIEAYEDGRTIRPVLAELGVDVDEGAPATQGPAEAAVLRLLRARTPRTPA
ncbi:DNA topoisomerase IB [Actinomadura parmotrematis]|uniref:DNA topoisomerase n=1 Tax=Actinomadura parmotrematis TaxID=2864039 RepID=A0ABS7G019_9ACTN|nr:DNA topoisomerase IB [Actinomadura parmotrematis]MBW8485214.1 DNA topoisomerase IB [Actinomadura parmotrematis]